MQIQEEITMSKEQEMDEELQDDRFNYDPLCDYVDMVTKYQGKAPTIANRNERRGPEDLYDISDFQAELLATQHVIMRTLSVALLPDPDDDYLPSPLERIAIALEKIEQKL